jgi:hypothetical protein
MRNQASTCSVDGIMLLGCIEANDEAIHQQQHGPCWQQEQKQNAENDTGWKHRAVCHSDCSRCGLEEFQDLN